MGDIFDADRDLSLRSQNVTLKNPTLRWLIENKIFGKPIPVSFHCLIQNLDRNIVKLGEVVINHDLLAS